MCNNITDTLAK